MHYGALSTLAMERGELLYNVVAKAHCYWHLVQATNLLNPRAGWCYKYEDFMHKCLTATMACANATANQPQARWQSDILNIGDIAISNTYAPLKKKARENVGSAVIGDIANIDIEY